MSTPTPTPTPSDVLLHDLSRPEHLLVWTLRAIALGNEDCPIVASTFRRVCGREGDEALQAYSVYVSLIARRRLRVHVPGCACVGRDELAVVAVIAAAQSSLHDLDEAPLRGRLVALVGRDPDEALLFVAQSIARLLSESGLGLNAPMKDFGDAAAAGRATLGRALH
jgi:hypothetical protein